MEFSGDTPTDPHPALTCVSTTDPAMPRGSVPGVDGRFDADAAGWVALRSAVDHVGGADAVAAVFYRHAWASWAHAVLDDDVDRAAVSAAAAADEGGADAVLTSTVAVLGRLSFLVTPQAEDESSAVSWMARGMVDACGVVGWSERMAAFTFHRRALVVARSGSGSEELAAGEDLHLVTRRLLRGAAWLLQQVALVSAADRDVAALVAQTALWAVADELHTELAVTG